MARTAAFLNDYAVGVLRLYLERMRDLVATSWQRRRGELLFGMHWERLGKRVNQVLARAGSDCGCPRFRSHAFGYHLLRSGCSIRHIQQLLGHRRLRNTEVYTKVDQQGLQRVLDRYHPRSLQVARQPS